MNKYDRPLVTLDNNALVAYFNTEVGEAKNAKGKEMAAQYSICSRYNVSI